MKSERTSRTAKTRLKVTRPNVRLAADIGGTFTDIAVFDDKTGVLTLGKALSTPHRLVDGINAGVALLAFHLTGSLPGMINRQRMGRRSGLSRRQW